MKKLKSFSFCRNSAPFGADESKSVGNTSVDSEIANGTAAIIPGVGIDKEIQLPTYIQIDPDSGEIVNQISYGDSCGIPEIYKRLLEDALKSPGTGVQKYDEDIQWADHKKLKEGKEFIHRNYFAILFSHLVGILLIIAVKPVQALLLRTSSTHKIEKALTFYLKTVVQVLRWYLAAPELGEITNQPEIEGEFSVVRTSLEDASNSFRKFLPPVAGDLRLASTKECHLYTAFREDLKNCGQEIPATELKSVEKIRTTVNPDIPLSQYDLAVIHFAFFGPALLFPRIFGIFERKQKGFDGFVHIWAIVGHRLGLKEEFNLALSVSEGEGKTTEELKFIFNNIFYFSFRIADDLTFRLWKVLIAGFSKYFIFARADVLLNFMCNKLFQIRQLGKGKIPKNVKVRNLWNVMSLLHKCYYVALTVILGSLLRWAVIRWFINAIARMILYVAKLRFLNSGKGRELRHQKSVSESTLSRWSSCQTVVVKLDSDV